MFKQALFVFILMISSQAYAMAAPLVKAMKTGATYGLIFGGTISSPVVMAKNLPLEQKMFIPMLGAGIGAVSGACVGIGSHFLSPYEENGKSSPSSIHLPVAASVVGTLAGVLMVAKLNGKNLF